MPPKRRANQTKRAPSTSPTTSTSHPPEHAHQLRHAGPSITSRAVPSKSRAQPASTPKSQLAEKDVPEKPSPADTRTSWSRLVYISLSVALLLLAWYVYGMVNLLDDLRDQVSWWGIIAGDSSRPIRWETIKEWTGFPEHVVTGSGSGSGEGGGDKLERSLNALADALGIDPVEVASAVRPLVPRASLVSGVTGEGTNSEAMRTLVGDTMGEEGEARVVEEGDAREDTVDDVV